MCKHITNPFALATYQGYCSQLIKNIVCKYTRTCRKCAFATKLIHKLVCKPTHSICAVPNIFRTHLRLSFLNIISPLECPGSYSAVGSASALDIDIDEYPHFTCRVRLCIITAVTNILKSCFMSYHSMLGQEHRAHGHNISPKKTKKFAYLFVNIVLQQF